MTIIKNSWGTEIDFEIAIHYMDEDLREKIHYVYAPCTEERFFRIYCEQHIKKFGKEFEWDKENPIV